MNKFLALTIVSIMFLQTSFSQEVKFGEVSKEELHEGFYTKDSTADAAVLYRKIDISFNYTEASGFVIERAVHERVKIFNKEGFKYGTVVENLYRGSNADEKFFKLKAFTFNLVEGQIEKIKLKNSDTFKEETSKYYTKEKFTMPNLKVGSVIEYRYTVSSPFYSSFNEIILQYNIPIVQQEIKVAIPEYFVFKNMTKGYLVYNINKSSKNVSITTLNRSRDPGGNQRISSSSNTDYRINISSVSMNNVPALKKEIYVNSMNNYRSAIKYELQYIKFPNSSVENYSSTWESVVEKIYESDDFGKQLNVKRYYKEDLVQIISGKVTEEEKLNAVFKHVQTRMNWNDIYGYSTDEGVKKAYELKTGNVADINLMLVSMLRSAGLNANPVLVSTRSNGVPLFPTRYGFNYVVAVVNIGGKNVFLDATSKYSKPNMTPVRSLNWAGRVVKEGGLSKSVSLLSDTKSLENVMMIVSISEDGNAKGKIRRICRDYIAYRYRVNNADINEETYLEKLEEKYNGLEISDYEIKNKKIVGKPITEKFSFDMENGAEIIGDKMYVSPLFWFAQKENPFKAEKREYPIDYAYPWEDKYSFAINIPEGYKVESIPTSVNVKIGEGIGQFVFHIAKTPRGLQLKSNISINKAIITPLDYQALKDFYKAIVEKQTEKVVLSKI